MIHRHLFQSIVGIAGISILFAFAKINGGFLSWFLLYFFLGVLLYEVFTSWFSLRGVQIERHVTNHHLSASQTLNIELSLIQNSVWPLFFATIHDGLPEQLALRADTSIQTIIPMWKRRVVVEYRIEKIQRGIYHLGDIRIESGDLLGITKVAKNVHCHDEIVVYPHIVPIRGWSGTYAEDLGQKQPFRRRNEESANVIGIRGYVPGDELSRIHWPASAKTGMLQAKEFEQHVSNEWMFIPDVSLNSFVHSDNGRLFDLEMTITASLMKYAHDSRKKFSAGIYTNRLLHFSAMQGQGPFIQCMKTLAELEPISQVPFAVSLQRFVTEFQAGNTFVVISPCLTKEMTSIILSLKKRCSIEWFIPMAQSPLTNEALHLMHVLNANHIRLHFISSPAQLMMLERGRLRDGKKV